MLEKDCDDNTVQLSISTIASAIANASMSSDPAQLAAMIIELSQKSHFKSSMMTAAQQTPIAGNMSVSDMEKYLQRVERSASDSEVDASQSCVDILGLTAGRDVSHQIAEPPVENELLDTGIQSDDERKGAIAQPKAGSCLPTALKMLSSMNCNLQNTGEPPLKSEVLAECKPGSAAKSKVLIDSDRILTSQGIFPAPVSIKGNDRLFW